MANVKITNRSIGLVGYDLPEIKVKRTLNPGDSKEITMKELNALWQTPGGRVLIKEDLIVSDKEWCQQHWDVPIEYFWGAEEVRKCLLEDSLDLFSETLDYAPGGVRELIKQAAWQIPVSDRNKAHIIREKLNFDIESAIKIMSTKKKASDKLAGRTRLRKEE